MTVNGASKRRGTRRVVSFLSLAGTLLAARGAKATGFTDIGQDITPRTDTAVKLGGYWRMRGEMLHDLDLNRGLTPSGQTLFPQPASDPNGHTLYGGDMRLRTDLAIYAPGGGVAVKARIDTLDDVMLGSTTPAGSYAAATTQTSPQSALRVKRVYGEALTPIGLLAAGRMGNHWGLGMLANGGDCADCDSGDSADRVAFLTPVLGHVIALAYDFSATGPVTPRKDGVRSIDLEPSDDVHTVTFAFLRFHDQLARERLRQANRATVEYGAYVSHRWQKNDVPASYLPVAEPVPITGAQVMYRGYTATAADLWVRFATRAIRVEAEGAYLTAKVDQPSLIPGALFRDPVTSRQLGGALESDLGAPEDPLSAGLDAGYASGDPAPGFGAYPAALASAPKRGDLDGPQASPPHDDTVDNFRFHPDYRIDRILFREIIGTVTDAVYLRPHARATLIRNAAFQVTASVAGIASWAVYADSAPGQRHPLGVEVDPTLAIESNDGFLAALEHGVLFPLSGLDNPQHGLVARPAQMVRLRLMYLF